MSYRDGIDARPALMKLAPSILAADLADLAGALAVCERGGAVESLQVRATSLPTLVQMVAGGLGVTLLPEAAAAALVPPNGPIALAAFAAPAPGRTIGLAWRTSSARLREFRMLAETMREQADKLLARLRR